MRQLLRYKYIHYLNCDNGFMNCIYVLNMIRCMVLMYILCQLYLHKPVKNNPKGTLRTTSDFLILWNKLNSFWKKKYWMILISILGQKRVPENDVCSSFWICLGRILHLEVYGNISEEMFCAENNKMHVPILPIKYHYNITSGDRRYIQTTETLRPQFPVF